MNIKTIQKELKQNNLTGSLFTLGNMFIDEDILPEENQIQALTGFSGSYALLFVTQTKAYLFVDGRYELQAKKEVNLKQIEIVKLAEICFTDWLKKITPKPLPIFAIIRGQSVKTRLSNCKACSPKQHLYPRKYPKKCSAPTR